MCVRADPTLVKLFCHVAVNSVSRKGHQVNAGAAKVWQIAEGPQEVLTQKNRHVEQIATKMSNPLLLGPGSHSLSDLIAVRKGCMFSFLQSCCRALRLADLALHLVSAR